MKKNVLLMVITCVFMVLASFNVMAQGAQEADDTMKVEVVAKGFQHQFWQVVRDGAMQAGKDLAVDVNFDGPQSESDISGQVNILKNVLSRNPDAICLAALDTESVTSELEEARSKNIPVIGFDSGVPNAPAGSIYATASTDNETAAALAAEMMMKDSDFANKVKSATAASPVVIGVIAQDAVSSSQIGRTVGFVDKMKELAEASHPGAVKVIGHSNYVVDSKNPAAVIIDAVVPPTADIYDMKNAAQTLLRSKGLIGVFNVNEGAVSGFLAATNDAADLAAGGKYEDLLVAGFDAGSTQKNAVREGWFIGSVTQDPFQIGYKAVKLAVDAANGKSVADVDTGAKWYTSENMDDEGIANLLYD